METLSKKEIAEKLGFVYPSKRRVDYRKLEKWFKRNGLFLQLKMNEQMFKSMHKERFNSMQTKIIMKHLTN